ncbi:MAG: hypothetical protein ACTSQE_09985 [Candidatus Heimdallarchaeaceae archaeon]
METEHLSLIISIVALLISILSFYYIHMRKGKLIFAKPHLYYLYKCDNHFIITFPVNITNTGAVVHTIDFLLGIVTSETNDNVFEFPMSKNLDGLLPSDEKKAPYINSFEVSPRSSQTKLISFESEVSYLPDGEYAFELAGHIDGCELIIRDLMTFDIEINEETRKGLVKDRYNVTSHYTIEEQEQLSEKQIKKYKIKRWGLISLIVVLFLLFTISINISTMGQIDLGPLTLTEWLFYSLIFITVYLFTYSESRTYIVNKQIKRCKK